MQTQIQAQAQAQAEADAQESAIRLLQQHAQHARAYVWMHSMCARVHTFASAVLTILQCIASYAAGSLGVALATASSSNSNSNANTNANTNGAGAAALSVSGLVLSFIVGAVSTFGKARFANFDTSAAQHAASIKSWNSLWAFIDTQMSAPEAARLPVAAAWKQAEDTFVALETESETLLPLWVRRRCARAFAALQPPCALPDMCIDANLL